MFLFIIIFRGVVSRFGGPGTRRSLVGPRWDAGGCQALRFRTGGGKIVHTRYGRRGTLAVHVRDSVGHGAELASGLTLVLVSDGKVVLRGLGRYSSGDYYQRFGTWRGYWWGVHWHWPCDPCRGHVLIVGSVPNGTVDIPALTWTPNR